LAPGGAFDKNEGMHPFLLRDARHFGRPVCRLGLASRGTSKLSRDDVLYAIERGVNFLNWPALSEGDPPNDAFRQAIASLGPRRQDVVVCIQLAARTANEAAAELRAAMAALATNYLDVVTFYYVEHASEWQALAAPDGALAWCERAKADGVIRRLGITSHQ